MAIARCEDCNILIMASTRSNEGIVAGHVLCSYCWDAAGLENEHSDTDGDHDGEGAVEGCRECGTYDPCMYWGEIEKKKALATGRKQQHRSHKGCDHEATSKARAICRKNRALVLDNGLKVSQL